MATIREVAQQSGFSTTTVSFVLNNSRAVNAKTRERVLAAARELNYHPNGVARGLLRGRMNALGVVFPDAHFPALNNPYYSEVLTGIVEVAVRKQMKTTLFSGQVWADTHTSLPVYCDGTCDGLLVFSPRVDSDIVAGLRGARVPFVLLNSFSELPEAPFVDVDNVEAARVMTDYLLGLGHRRVGFLSTIPRIGHYPRQRREGYEQALAQHGIPLDRSLIGVPDEYPGGLTTLLKEWVNLPLPARPTALFCATDLLALYVVEALQTLSVRIPQQMSVAGFNDTTEATACSPALTTMRQPLRTIGERAAEILVDQINGKNDLAHQQLFAAELIGRASTAPPLLPSSPS